MRNLLALCLMLVWLPASAASQWLLNASESSFQFGTVKKGAVYETNSFEDIKGYIGSHGMADLTVDLASVNTGIAIRDTRMKTMLFNLADFPKAYIRVPVDISQMDAMGVGEMWPLSTGGDLKLNGKTATILAELRVYRISEERWLVKTAEPIIVDAAAFALSDGVEALRKVAGLDSIMPKVPVFLELVYDRQ